MGRFRKIASKVVGKIDFTGGNVNYKCEEFEVLYDGRICRDIKPFCNYKLPQKAKCSKM